MAFEEVSVSKFKTYLTKLGVRQLLQPNNKLDIKYFSLNDEGVNYRITGATSALITSPSGDDFKSLYNGPNNIREISDVIVVDDITKRELVAIDKCNNLEYKNITATVYLGNYLQKLTDTLGDLSNVSNDFDTSLTLFDYIQMDEYTENARGEYSLVGEKDVNLRYTFNSSTDRTNWERLMQAFVSKSNNTTTITYNENRFPSPFYIGPGSIKKEGIITQNGPFTLTMAPGELGYNIGGVFRRPEELTQDLYNSNQNIKPQVRFNGILHDINTNTTSYKPQVNLPIFRFDKLLNSGVVATNNLFNRYGKVSDLDPNVRVISIKWNINTPLADNATKPKDFTLTLNLTLDTNQSNWNGSGTIVDINN